MSLEPTQVLVAVPLLLSLLFCIMRALFPTYSPLPLKNLFPSRERPDPTEKVPSVVYGLINTGNSCFINSVLQALSSLTSLPDFLEELLERKAREPLRLQNVDLPITEALLDTVLALNEPVPLNRHQSFRPTQIVQALASNRRVINHEQQDAQEFFQIVTSGIESEDALTALGRGWWAGGKMGKPPSLFDIAMIQNMLQERKRWNAEKSEILDGKRIESSKQSRPEAYPKKLFAGLQASRLSCMQCGYTAAIRHFTFNNLSLTLPRRPMCSLESCLDSFTSIEVLHDCVCRRCSLGATLTHTDLELKRFRAPVRYKHDHSSDASQMSEEDESHSEGSSETSEENSPLPVPYMLPGDISGSLTASTNNSSALNSPKTFVPPSLGPDGSISSDDDEPLFNTSTLIRPRDDSSAEITIEGAAPHTTIQETRTSPATTTMTPLDAPMHSTSTPQNQKLRRRRNKNDSSLRSGLDGHFTNKSFIPSPLTSPHTATSQEPEPPDGYLAKREAEKRAVEEAKRRVEEAMMGDVEREIEKEDGSEIGIDLVSVWDRVYLKVQSRCSTKQVMIAKAPQVLCLHLSRSTYTPYGVAMKNGCTVTFPEYLDLSPYMTTGELSTRPDMPISSTAKGIRYFVPQYYRLMAVIVHFGSHAFGHFVAYRRRGNLLPQDEEEAGETETIADDGISSKAGSSDRTSQSNAPLPNENPARDDLRKDVNREDPYAWYRISDDQVEFVSIRQVLGANPYMLLYERAEQGEGERENEREKKELNEERETEEDEVDDGEVEKDEEEGSEKEPASLKANRTIRSM